MGLRIITLEEENRSLKDRIRGDIKHSNYTNYSASEILKDSQSPSKSFEKNQIIKEIQMEFSSSLSKNSNEITSPNNSLQSGKPISESGSENLSNYRGLETIPEESISMNKTQNTLYHSDCQSNKKDKMHLSMPVHEPITDKIQKQPNFMFNSLGQQVKVLQTNNSAFVNRGFDKDGERIPFAKSGDMFMFKTDEMHGEYDHNPFLKHKNHEDIEVETESQQTSSKEGHFERMTDSKARNLRDEYFKEEVSYLIFKSST